MSNKSQLQENNSLLQTILSIASNRQDKSITPSDAVQTVSADAGGKGADMIITLNEAIE